ncbi:MAG: glycosyltransferase family 39 protein, partial [Candidatus Shapirobacteria bacterium]|nr:glycosyltransferase family 39 protein [Candidatus Shapirobacteria bacterium]
MSKVGKNLIFFLILFVSIIPTFYSLLKSDYYVMHDDTQMIRQLEFEKCLKDGQIPCRWSPDLGYEYGYPLFNFYPPMPYIVGQFYRTLGFSFMNSVKFSAATQIILSTFFMYLLVKAIFGQIGGLFSALFYAYAPYHALNIYVRGAYNEAWATVFFPLIFYFSYKLIKTGKSQNIIGLALSYSGLFLSHNPMLLTFTPFFLAWSLFWLIIEKKINFSRQIIKQLPLFFKFFLSGLLALSLSAFFVLPMVFETKYTQIETMFQGYYQYHVHFVSLFQLFISNLWNDGASVPGPNDGLSFMIGYLHWILPLIIFLFSSFLLIKKKLLDKKIIISLFLFLLALLSIFFIHNKSTFLWQIFTPFQKIQFPWRFLNHTVFLLSLSVAVIPFIFKKYINTKTSIITSSLLAII